MIPSLAKAEDLQNAVRSIGYDLVIDTENPECHTRKINSKAHYQAVVIKTIWSLMYLSAPVIAVIGMFFHEHALRKLYIYGAGCPGSILFWSRFFYKRLETSAAWQSQYGYAGCFVYWHSLLF
jgi:Cu2+-exporting ATPase